jgi:uncharacterized peroxidase-related enzyme
MTFQVHTLNDAPAASKSLLEKVEEKFDFIPNQMGVLSESPQALEAYMTLDRLMKDTSFSEKERDVVLLAVSFENRCEYCMSGHSKMAQEHGLPEDVIESLRSGQPIRDERFQALRAYTLELMQMRGHITQETKQRFLDAGYGPKQALEIMLGISMKTLANYANNLAHTPVDEAFKSAQWRENRAN